MFKDINRKAIVVGIIAGILVILDGLITHFLDIDASFTWVAFVSWTVFFGSNIKERLEAVVGFIIGFFAAIFIMKLGNVFSFIKINFIGISLASVIATMIVNYLCMLFECFKKWFTISISGIFVGIALTFSGLGINLNPTVVNDSFLMILVILVYGILGLLSGWATLKFGTKK